MRAIVLTLTILTMSSALASDEVILASVSYWLDKADLARYQDEAMQGSPEAALKVVHHYRMRGIPDNVRAKRWAIIGSENGSAECQFVLYQLLSPSANRAEQKRALFWLQQSADHGYDIGKAIIQTCSSLSSRSGDKQNSPCFGPGSQD